VRSANSVTAGSH